MTKIKTKFLRNAWYAAIWAHDLPDATPIAKIFLNEPVVLFRTEGGEPVALEDKCCHRAAPLSVGECIGDTIQCGYHGLRFNATGACVEIPGQSKIPQNATVRSYPVIDRWNMVWIWMGVPEKATKQQFLNIFG